VKTPRLFRSFLFAPAHQTRLVDKVFSAGADAIVLDLEDAVPPAEKAAARRVVGALLESGVPDDPPLFVRINGMDSDLWREDLAAVVAPGLCGLRLPKIDSLEALRRFDEELSSCEGRAGLPFGALELTLAIESAAGVLESRDLARHPRVARLAFGAADFAAELGLDLEDPLATLHARSHLVLASRAAGILPPLAPVYTRLRDPEGLARAAAENRRLGFFGQSCIHPEQLAIVHQVFAPDARALAEARTLLEAAARAEREGHGALRLPDGRFVDRALVAHAERVLAFGEEVRR
jgi:citrate lyase subunit beta / citryl-CoA lyase